MPTNRLIRPLRCVTPVLITFLALNCRQLGAEINVADVIRPILSDNCFQCHGPDEEQRKADLRLDTPDGIASVLDEDDLSASEFLRRINSTDPDEVMPPPTAKKRLHADQIDQLNGWVTSGAKWESHWSFAPIMRPRLPAVSSTRIAQAKNPIDRFVHAKIEANGLTPSREAARSVLIRRVYLDLLGLLPEPHDVQSFENDKTSNAYEQLVDRILSNPRFGERWGRHWLDQARYADSDGYSIDGNRDMWPYRDWVIKALNEDMPFDRFTVAQLAGDLLPNPTVDQLVATGFHRNTLVNQEGGSDPEQFRIETVVDRVNTTSAVWLGLTLGCAQCHTHKFDPITHHDYYHMFAFFNSGVDKNEHEPRMVVAPREQVEELDQLKSKLTTAQSTLKELREAKADNAATLKNVRTLQSEIRSLENRYGKTMIMRDLETPRETFVHIRGDFLRPSDRVEPEIPAILGQLPDESSKNRLGLATWLVDGKNPLTARVTVNRLWLQYFGRGLVETENDFGVQGTQPTHPLLLDWLASELMRQEWSLKAIHRLIVTSATYRQSSRIRPELDAVDVGNFLLGRQSRLRVSGEIVRDLALSASGALSNKIGGPSVYPPQPAGVYSFTQNRKTWNVSSGEDRYRRGMYTFFYRSAPHPFLTTFDTPNFQTTCTKRLRSNTPLQSLTLANDQSVMDAAISLSQSLLTKFPVSDQDLDEQRVAFAFQRCLTRSPNDFESNRLLQFVRQQRVSLSEDTDAAKKLTQQSDRNSNSESESSVELATWISFSRVLLNLDEFVTRN